MKLNALVLTTSLMLYTGIFSHVYAEKIKGNGNITTKEVNVNDYSSIKLGSGIECKSRLFDKKTFKNPVFNYSQSDGNAMLTITIDENLFSLLDISSSNNKLVVGVKKGAIINPSQLVINGNSANLQKLSVSGCIDWNLVSDFKSERLEVEINGASDVKINRSARIIQFKIGISGAGDVTLRGKADNGIFAVSGAGDIKAFDFIVAELDCKVSGAGDIKETATNTLNAAVSGVGDIHYKGDAKANTQVSGFGDIKKVE